MTADLVEENTASTQASEMLEAESAERMHLEKELKDLQVSYFCTFINSVLTGIYWKYTSIQDFLLPFLLDTSRVSFKLILFFFLNSEDLIFTFVYFFAVFHCNIQDI